MTPLFCTGHFQTYLQVRPYPKQSPGWGGSSHPAQFVANRAGFVPRGMSRPTASASSARYSPCEHLLPTSRRSIALRPASLSTPLIFLSAFGAAWGHFIAAFGWRGVLLGWWPAAVIGVGGALAVLQGIELARLRRLPSHNGAELIRTRRSPDRASYARGEPCRSRIKIGDRQLPRSW